VTRIQQIYFLQETPVLTLNNTKIVIAAFAAALLTACGGGVDSVAVSDAGSYTVESGVAQKGPLAQGSEIFVSELSATTYQPNGKTYPFATNNNLGTFTPGGITYSTPYLSTLAQGYYFNEITGTYSNDIVDLRGLSQVGTGGDTVINVNVLSSMAVNRVTKLATTAPVKTFALARAQAQRELLAAFYVYNGTAILTGTTVNNIAQPANLTALDLSKSRAGDQMLAALSGVVMTAGVNGNGVNTLLSQIAVDLGDDGLLNNSTNYRTSVKSKLCAAAAATDFANVATNLNTLYGTTYSATDLSQWVDTSGCVDQVINKYKFTASNVAVGTVSKSPAYTVGADDVGQCFSVGGVTTGATAKLYYNGGATAVVGTQLVKANDTVTIGINASTAGTYSGFIQRSAPAVNGTCPTVVPLNGLTRVAKYATDVVNAVASSFPIQAARINDITTPLTTVGSFSGTLEGYAASGSVTLSTSALSTAVFEGVNRSAKSTTQSGTISYNGNSSSTNSTSISYYDASANFYGYTTPYSYGVVISRTPIPVSVRVGDSGNLHVLNRYTDSTKRTLSAVETATYSVEPDTANTALVKISTVEKDTLGVVTSQDVLTYRITSSGAFNLVNRTVYTPTGVNVTITFTAPCDGTTTFCVYSPSVVDGGVIPTKFAAATVSGGQNNSPALEIKNVPAAANYLSVVVDDETVPCGTGLRACVHAGLFDIPKTKVSWSESNALAGISGYTVGGVVGGTYGYVGPFPPIAGGVHTYKLTVYAHKSSWASYGVIYPNGSHTSSFGRPPVTRAEIEADQGPQAANDIVSSKTLTFTFSR